MRDEDKDPTVDRVLSKLKDSSTVGYKEVKSEATSYPECKIYIL